MTYPQFYVWRARSLAEDHGHRFQGRFRRFGYTFSGVCQKCGKEAWVTPTWGGRVEKWYVAGPATDSDCYAQTDPQDEKITPEPACWCGGTDGEHNDEAHAQEGVW